MAVPFHVHLTLSQTSPVSTVPLSFTNNVYVMKSFTNKRSMSTSTVYNLRVGKLRKRIFQFLRPIKALVLQCICPHGESLNPVCSLWISAHALKSFLTRGKVAAELAVPLSQPVSYIAEEKSFTKTHFTTI